MNMDREVVLFLPAAAAISLLNLNLSVGAISTASSASNLFLGSWKISLRALKYDNRSVASSPNSSSEITGRPFDVGDALLNQHS